MSDDSTKLDLGQFLDRRPGDSPPSRSGMASVLGYEMRDPLEKELSFFKKNPQVGGMAAEDNRIVMNPFSPLDDAKRGAVAVNEAVRLYLRENKPDLNFEITPEQRNLLKGTVYEKPENAQAAKETIIGRIISGDPTAGTPTREQMDFVSQVRSDMAAGTGRPGNGAGAYTAPIDTSRPMLENADNSFSTERTITIDADGRWYNIPTIVGGKQLSEEAAIEAWRSGRNPEVGSFGSLEEAERYAKQRSAEIGRVRGAERAYADGAFGVEEPKSLGDFLDPQAREANNKAIEDAAWNQYASRTAGSGRLPFPTLREVMDSEGFAQASTASKQKMVQTWMSKALEVGPQLFTKKKDRQDYEETILSGMPKIEAPKRTWGEFFGDVYSAAASGARGVGAGIGSLVQPEKSYYAGDPGDLANFFNPVAQGEAMQKIEDTGYSEKTRDVEKMIAENRAKRIAEGAGLIERTVGAAADVLANPSTALMKRAVEQVPLMAATIIPGVGTEIAATGLVGRSAVVAARTAMKEAAAQGLGKAAIREAGEVARAAALKPAVRAGQATAAAGGGVLEAGQARQQVIEEMLKAPDEFWDKDPEFKDALEKAGGDRQRAKLAIAADRSKLAAAFGFAMGAAGGVTGLEALFVGPAGRGFRKMAARMGEELSVEEATEIGEQIEGNRQRMKLQPDWELLAGVPEVAGETFATVLPFAGAAGAPALRRGTEQRTVTPEATPTPTTPGAAGEAAGGAGVPPPPATLRESIGARVAAAEAEIQTIQADTTLTDDEKQTRVAEAENKAQQWRDAAAAYDNTPAAQEVVAKADQLVSEIEEIAAGPGTEADKAARIKARQEQLTQLETLRTLNELDERQLEAELQSRKDTLMEADTERGIGVKARPGIAREMAHIEQLLTERAFVRTPEEVDFQGRTRNVFPVDNTKNPVIPSPEEQNSKAFEDAIDLKQDAAMALVNSIITNPVSKNADTARTLRTLRGQFQQLERLREAFTMDKNQLAERKDQLINAMGAALAGRTQGTGQHLAELAAVLAAEAKLDGKSLTFNEALQQAQKTMADLFAPPPIPGGTPKGTTWPANEAPAQTDKPTEFYNDTEFTYNGKLVARPTVSEERQGLWRNAIDALEKLGFNVDALNALGLRIADGSYALGVYFGGDFNRSAEEKRSAYTLAINWDSQNHGKHGPIWTVIHEIAHALDNALGTDWFTRTNRLFYPGGDLHAELKKAYDDGKGPLKDLHYPFSPMWGYGESTTAKELWAQGMAYYFLDRKMLQRHAPQTFKLMEAITNELAGSTLVDRSGVADAIRQAISQSTGPTSANAVPAATTGAQPATGGAGVEPTGPRPLGRGNAGVRGGEGGSVAARIADAQQEVLNALNLVGNEQSIRIVSDALARIQNTGGAQTQAAARAGPNQGAQQRAGQPAGAEVQPAAREQPKSVRERVTALRTPAAGPRGRATGGEAVVPSRAAPRGEGDRGRVAELAKNFADAVASFGHTTLDHVIRAWHGSPHKFNKYLLTKISSGEGAQMYGWGLYFADLKQVAESYRKVGEKRRPFRVGGKPLDVEGQIGEAEGNAAVLWADHYFDYVAAAQAFNSKVTDANVLHALDEAIDEMETLINDNPEDGFNDMRQEAIEVLKEWRKQKPVRNEERGYLYENDLNVNQEDLLDLDKTVNQQPPKVRKALKEIAKKYPALGDHFKIGELTGRAIYTAMVDEANQNPAMMRAHPDAKTAPEIASKTLRDAGIPGIRYFDQFSREKKKGTANYVIFDDSLIKIEEISEAANAVRRDLNKNKEAKSTRKSINRALAKLLGVREDTADALPNVRIVTSDQISPEGKLQISPTREVSGLGNNTLAFYDATSNIVTFIRDRIPAGWEMRVIAHELFHKRGGQLLGRKGIERFRNELMSWKNAPENSPERRVYNAAQRRLAEYKFGTKEYLERDLAPGVIREELLPYAIEEAIALGYDFNPNNAMKAGVAGMLARFGVAVRKALAKFLRRDPKQLTVQDLLAAAYGAVNLELPSVQNREKVERLMKSRESFADAQAEYARIGDFAYNPDKATADQRQRGVRPTTRIRRVDPQTGEKLYALSARRAGTEGKGTIIKRFVREGELARVREREAKNLPFDMEIRAVPMYENGLSRQVQQIVDKEEGKTLVEPTPVPSARWDESAPGPSVEPLQSSRYFSEPKEARPIKSVDDMRTFTTTGELPTAPWWPTRKSRFIENWMDHQQPLYEWLKAHKLDFGVWKALKLVPGRLRAIIKGYNKDIIDPLHALVADLAETKKLSVNKASEIVGQWATFRHVPEANAALQSKLRRRIAEGDNAALKDLLAHQAAQREGVRPADPEHPTRKAPMAGGYTDAEAELFKANLLRQFPSVTAAELDAIGDKIVDAFAKMKEEGLKSGQIKPEAAKNFPKFKHYVALTGTPWDDDMSDAFGSYISENKLKEREGRTTSVADDALTALTDRASRIAAYASSTDFKDALNKLWTDAGGMENTIGLTRVESEKGGSIMHSDIIWQDRDTGKRYIFRFTDPHHERVGDAILSKNKEYTDANALQLMDRLTRTFSRAVTQWVPMFAPINMMRDVQEKALLIRSRGVLGPDGQPLNPNKLFGRVWAAAISPDTWRAATQLAFGGGVADNNTKAGRYANELVANGGVSTWGEITRRGRNEIHRAVKAHTKGRKQIAGLDNVVANYNLLFEIISSLSSNAAMRDMGVDAKEAAFQTLDLMNFNNAGAKASWVRALYSFFNPAMQSGRNLWRQLGTKRGFFDFMGVLAVSGALYALTRAASDDDDELGKQIDQRGSFETERNVVIQIGGAFLKLPVGFGLSQFAWGTIVNSARMLSGRYDVPSGLGQMATQFIKTFSPVAPSEVEIFKQPAHFFAKTMTPTVFRPLIDLVSDTNAWGQKLSAFYPQAGKFESEQGRAQTPVLYKEMAQYARKNLGIDLYPEQWRVIADGVAWGPAGYALRALADQNKENEGRRLDPLDQIPGSGLAKFIGVSRFVGGPSRYLDQRYYEQYGKASVITKEYNAAKARGKGAQYLTADPARAQLLGALQRQEREMRALTKDYNQIVRDMQNNRIDLVVGRKRLEVLQDKKERLQRQFLRGAGSVDLSQFEDVEEEQ